MTILKTATLGAALMIAGCTSEGASLQDQDTARCDDIWTINSVTVLPEMETQAQRYYEAAWLPARVRAKAKGIVKDYMLMSSGKPDQPDIQLITVYEDDQQWNASEDAFQAIFKELGLPRPLLIDGLERSQIIADTIGADDYRFVRSVSGPCN